MLLRLEMTDGRSCDLFDESAIPASAVARTHRIRRSWVVGPIIALVVSGGVEEDIRHYVDDKFLQPIDVTLTVRDAKEYLKIRHVAGSLAASCLITGCDMFGLSRDVPKETLLDESSSSL